MGIQVWYPDPVDRYQICTSTSRPASPQDGMLIYETDTKRLMVYDTTMSGWFQYLGVHNGPAQQMAGGVGSGTTGSGGLSAGYLTHTHGLGWTPDFVVVTGKAPLGGSNIAASSPADSFTSTTFRVRFINQSGGAIDGQSVEFSWIAGRDL